MGKAVAINVMCPYCDLPAKQVGGFVIYPQRTDLSHRFFWLCGVCHAYVGCHPGTNRPLGRLANAELRKWKQKAHAVFDPWWKSGRLKRREAYARLAKALGIPEEETHIGMFDVDRCKQVVALCSRSACAKGDE